jgi:cell division protein FtsB
MRRITALLAALYVVFMIYSLELYMWGETGLIATQDLERYKERLQQNIADLQDVQVSLGTEFDGLQKSSEKIGLSARKLGYFQPEEHRVVVEHMKLGNSYYVVGELLKPYRFKTVDTDIFLVLAFLFGISVYLILRFSGTGNPKHRR